jgi:hypothetical protein
VLVPGDVRVTFIVCIPLSICDFSVVDVADPVVVVVSGLNFTWTIVGEFKSDPDRTFAGGSNDVGESVCSRASAFTWVPFRTSIVSSMISVTYNFFSVSSRRPFTSNWVSGIYALN